jgi:hypothetical protein
MISHLYDKVTNKDQNLIILFVYILNESGNNTKIQGIIDAVMQ